MIEFWQLSKPHIDEMETLPQAGHDFFSNQQANKQWVGGRMMYYQSHRPLRLL